MFLTFFYDLIFSQDTFTWSSGNTHNELYKKIVYTEKNVVICPETDPKWRFAVLNDADCLFSFRWVSGRTSVDVYRIVQLTKRRLEFRAIKVSSFLPIVKRSSLVSCLFTSD